MRCIAFRNLYRYAVQIGDLCRRQQFLSRPLPNANHV